MILERKLHSDHLDGILSRNSLKDRIFFCNTLRFITVVKTQMNISTVNTVEKIQEKR